MMNNEIIINILSDKNGNLNGFNKLDKNAIAEIFKYLKLDSKEIINLERTCKELYKVINSKEFFNFISNEQNLNIKNIDTKDFFKQLKALRKSISRNKPFILGDSKNEFHYQANRFSLIVCSCLFSLSLMGPVTLLAKLISRFVNLNEDKNSKITDVIAYITTPIFLVSTMMICYSTISMIKHNKMKKGSYYKMIMELISEKYLGNNDYNLLFNSKINKHERKTNYKYMMLSQAKKISESISNEGIEEKPFKFKENKLNKV